MAKVFEYLVFKDEERDVQTKKVTDPAVVLVPPTVVVADDETQVGMIGARAIPEGEMENIGRISVVVRPF